MHVGCEEKKDCKTAGEICKPNDDKTGCDCGPIYPPSEADECCCCVKSVKVKKRGPGTPDPKMWTSFPSDGYWRVGHQFIVEAVLTHTGKRGKICQCKMTWAEYANQRYTPPKGKSNNLPGKKWNTFPDGKWDREYGSKLVGEWVEKTVEFTLDKPGPSLPIPGARWESWIEVCVRSCENATCKCKKKQRCARLHQVVRASSDGTTPATMDIDDNVGDGPEDDKNYSDDIDPPEGGWHSDH